MSYLTVIVCTHNPRKEYLSRVLEGLNRQTLPKDQWEFLLIDNGSSPALSGHWDLSWHPSSRHVREEMLGLTMARLCGIREARGELLVFVDDDNILDVGYLETARNLSMDWPKIGAFGGSQIGEYENKPVPDIEKYMPMLAVRTIREMLWTNIKGIDYATPRGAGLCIRRVLADNHSRKVEGDDLRKMLGRSGPGGFLSGEETDMIWSVCEDGYGMLVTPELTLTHLIGRKRTEKSYLLNIAEGHAISATVLNHIHHLPMASSSMVDYAREFLRFIQVPTLFDKRMVITGLVGRRKGSALVRQKRNPSPSTVKGEI